MGGRKETNGKEKDDKLGEEGRLTTGKLGAGKLMRTKYDHYTYL